MDVQPVITADRANGGVKPSRIFSSPFTTIKDALETGRLTLLTDSVAAKVLTRDGKATAIQYADTASKSVREVRGTIVLLCASTLESTRLLLNSGICNSSGTLGKYLMDHIYEGGASGIMPNLRLTLGRDAAKAEWHLHSTLP